MSNINNRRLATSTLSGLVSTTNQTFGGRKSAGNSKVRVRLSSDQAVSASGEVIEWQTKDFDTNSEFNATSGTVGSTPAHSFLPTRAGYYLVTVSVFFGSVNTAKDWELTIRKNGTAVARHNVTSNSTTVWVKVSDIILLNGTTDYIDGFIAHTDTSSRAMSSQSRDTYMSIVELL